MSTYTPLRRVDKAISDELARRILKSGTYGVLATCGADGAPYCVPVSYSTTDNFIYFHGASTGQKVENMRRDPRVCFTIVGETRPAYSQGSFTALYESVVAHGVVEQVHDKNDIVTAMRELCTKYLPQHMSKFEEAFEKDLPNLTLWRMRIEHLTGKAARK
eukprot:Protomagalhaensia_sp_Gyna_25__3994@NODE_359_length_3740_cov_212_002972_g277_i0_p3_GENE_NODE_359_length_3740_cov_212_002972_g277_i0NODE_359_length_3740_cov_212_002972_g277_i0_p3_ORF_typecomplete_len161_score10_17Pyridox_ox_2/PF12900_7/2_6e33Putative_PNPOx/PF01243_20/1_9e12Pyrid_ox_like/PF16242_5/1_3e07Pyrid_oxidase_2/PF13883_6/1e06FMN_bind_2/PF04299_12/0_035F420H2_quin_red/PF04075_14/0_17OTU/PF02338_19/5_5e03OTU/PF02338_19/0_35_NODE_359_length_3740_cov_212_002972_g277_i09551437